METEAVHPGPPPGLVRLVKVLGVIMILLFLALVGGIIWKSRQPATQPVMQDVVMELGLDPAAIKHMELSGNVLALSTDQELVVIDVRARKITLRAKKSAQ
jgi:hypothetical protein